MASNQQILSDLQLIMEADHGLELLVTYKGVPFICKARVQSIQADHVRLQASGQALICMQHEKRVKVLGSDFFEPSTAEVLSVDILTGQVELVNFSYLATKLGERMVLRVEPDSPQPVRFDIEDKQTTGQLLDLSLSGMGTRLQLSDYDPALKPGTSVKLSLDLPQETISMTGTVLSVARIGDWQRISIRFAPDYPHRQTIYRYLVDRRAEIEQELLEEYRNALRSKGVEPQ